MFNVFRHRNDPSIVCVISGAGIMPSFLRQDGWEYGGQVDELHSPMREYDRRAARAVIFETGFYVCTTH